ncbi:MAG: hypothetical protein EZS28_041995, partial [Streblomastix strix]
DQETIQYYIQSTISQIQASYQTCCLHDTDVQAQIEARKLALEMLPELKEYGVSEYLPAIGDWKEKVMKLKSKKQRQKWGKKTFTFVKFDKIKCDYCGNDALIHNRRQITQEDRQRVGIPLEWRCTRVETYKCIACNQDNLFYRYNNPIQIMKEKKGRCGEFANVFTLICKSIGFHSRLVDDVSSGGGDHVWTEIYDETGLGKKMDEMMNDEQELDEQNKQGKDKQELEQNEKRHLIEEKFNK